MLDEFGVVGFEALDDIALHIIFLLQIAELLVFDIFIIFARHGGIQQTLQPRRLIHELIELNLQYH